jgi:ABC-2 type transport system ATP-binding protein
MICAVGLVKRYGSTTAVDGLTFDVQPGRVTGFLGPNGAGKSTTMRLIVGLDAPSSGLVTVNGRAYRELRRPLFEVGAMLEAASVHPGRSAHAHLLALAQSNGIGKHRVAQVLDLVGLDGVASKRAGGFSLGMTQRLGIAAALLGDPGVLLLDEPVNGLDPDGVAWIRALLRSLAAQGRTVFVSSHLMSEMAATADHLIVIGRGRLIADTSVAEFVRSSAAGFVLVRSPDHERLGRVLLEAGGTVQPGGQATLLVTGMTTDEVGELAGRHGLVLHELTARDASLEDAFLHSTRDAVVYQPHTGNAGKVT